MPVFLTISKQLFANCLSNRHPEITPGLGVPKMPRGNDEPRLRAASAAAVPAAGVREARRGGHRIDR